MGRSSSVRRKSIGAISNSPPCCGLSRPRGHAVHLVPTFVET
jgi:hypothetical protein